MHSRALPGRWPKETQENRALALYQGVGIDRDNHAQGNRKNEHRHLGSPNVYAFPGPGESRCAVTREKNPMNTLGLTEGERGGGED